MLVILHSLQVVRCLKELSDKHVLALAIKLILHVVEELCDTDIIVLKELNDVHFLAVLLRLSDVGVLLEELGDGDVVFFEELDDCHVYVVSFAF